MIIVKIWGGVGNQLFQYVFGLYLHNKYNVEVRYDENSFLSTDKLRKRELDALESDIKWDNHCTFSKFRGVKGRLLRYIYQLHPKHYYIGRDEKLPREIDYSKEYFFQGYWQDYKYYKWLLNNVPSFKVCSKSFPSSLDSLKQQICANSQSISIHVRRGDYFSPQFISVYGVCTEDYFHKAMQIIKEKVPNGQFFIFSDDLDWAKTHLELDDSAVYVPNYDISQFAYIELMSLCKHHIISNSSFSWWGAVLNEQTDSIVISPSKWLLNTDKTIALEKWIKI